MGKLLNTANILALHQIPTVYPQGCAHFLGIIFLTVFISIASLFPCNFSMILDNAQDGHHILLAFDFTRSAH
jgi:hypothetical protein